jgi:hypothetical protein
MATQKKWLKKRPRVHALIRDLASLIGAGAGAYGTMRLMNYAIPAMTARNAANGTEAAAAQLQAPKPAPAANAPKTESK